MRSFYFSFVPLLIEVADDSFKFSMFEITDYRNGVSSLFSWGYVTHKDRKIYVVDFMFFKLRSL